MNLTQTFVIAFLIGFAFALPLFLILWITSRRSKKGSIDLSPYIEAVEAGSARWLLLYLSEKEVKVREGPVFPQDRKSSLWIPQPPLVDCLPCCTILIRRNAKSIQPEDIVDLRLQPKETNQPGDKQ